MGFQKGWFMGQLGGRQCKRGEENGVSTGVIGIGSMLVDIQFTREGGRGKEVN